MAEQLVAVARANGYTQIIWGTRTIPISTGEWKTLGNLFCCLATETNDIGRRAVDAEALIGYNVKLSSYDARFFGEQSFTVIRKSTTLIS